MGDKDWTLLADSFGERGVKTWSGYVSVNEHTTTLVTLEHTSRVKFDSSDEGIEPVTLPKVGKTVKNSSSASDDDTTDSLAEVSSSASAPAIKGSDDVADTSATKGDPANDQWYACSTGSTYATYNAKTLTAAQKAKAESKWPGKPASYYACVQGCKGQCTAKGEGTLKGADTSATKGDPANDQWYACSTGSTYATYNAKTLTA